MRFGFDLDDAWIHLRKHSFQISGVKHTSESSS